MEISVKTSPVSSGQSIEDKLNKYDRERDKSEMDIILSDVTDDDPELLPEEKRRYQAIFEVLKKQLRFERERSLPVWNVISKKETKEFSYFKLRSVHKFKIAGVLHRESRTGDLHSTFGVIAYDNRLLYTTDDGQEHTKIIRNKTKHFNRKREYETVYECDDLLPYTLTYGKEYPSTIQNLLLNIAHSVTMLSKEFMTREIAEFTKKNQRVIILTGIVCTVFGLIIGLLMGQFLHI